jgi:hypothetical protein
LSEWWRERRPGDGILKHQKHGDWPATTRNTVSLAFCDDF